MGLASTGDCGCSYEVDLLGRRRESTRKRLSFERCGCGPKAVRASELGREGALPLGSVLTTDASLRTGDASLGAGGAGLGGPRTVYRADIAYGARPAVPERLLTEAGWAIDSPRTRSVAAHPHAQEIEALRWGVDPRTAHRQGTYSPLTMNPGLPRESAAFRGQIIPALPAPQEVCIVNGFDPSWGEPPDQVGDVPVRFDADLGAYAPDPVYAQSHGSIDSSLLARKTFTRLHERWNQGLTLQPFKSPGETRWQYRWIPLARNVVCSEPATRTGVAQPRVVLDRSDEIQSLLADVEPHQG